MTEDIKTKTKDLYTAKDVRETRGILYNEQQKKDLLTGLELPENQCVLDHQHDDTQYVRGVLHRASNSFLGVIENGYKRYLKHWYPESLSTFLKQTAEYLDRKPDPRYRHPDWLKKIKIEFKKLNAVEQNLALEILCSQHGSNAKERLELFSEHILDRKFDYDTLCTLLTASKDEFKRRNKHVGAKG